MVSTPSRAPQSPSVSLCVCVCVCVCVCYDGLCSVMLTGGVYREGGLWLFHAVAVCHYCPEWMLEPRKDGVPVCISVTLDALTHSRVRPKSLPKAIFLDSSSHHYIRMIVCVRVRACVRAVPGA